MKTGTEAQTRGEGRAPCERRWEKRGKMGDEGGGNSATDLKQQRGADTECVRAMWVGVRDGDPETGRGGGAGGHSERGREKLGVTDSTWGQRGERGEWQVWDWDRGGEEGAQWKRQRDEGFQRGGKKGTHWNELTLGLTFFALSTD